MKNFDSKIFIDILYYQEYEIYYNGVHYLIDSNSEVRFDSDNNMIDTPLNLFVYPTSEGYMKDDDYIVVNKYSNIKPTFTCSEMVPAVVVEKFINAKIWDGKSFWEAESEMYLIC